MQGQGGNRGTRGHGEKLAVVPELQMGTARGIV